MADGIQFPDYYAQANDRAQQQQKLAQQMALTQGLQFENQQAQKTASKADQFMQQMMQQQQQSPNATWHDKIAGATDAAIKSGDYADADKIIGVWSKASDQESKAQADGQKAVAEDLANKQKKFAQQSSFLSGVSSQADLDQRAAAYKQTFGEDLPFKQYVPGMDKRFEDMSTTALERAKIISEQMSAKTAQQRADAETMKARAESSLDAAKVKTEATIQDRNTKEGAKFAAQAAAGGGGGTGTNADRYGYTQNVINAGINAGVDLDNLSKLPEGSGISWMSGMQDKTGPALTDALRANFARSLTPADRQTYKAASAGLSNALSIMQTNGRNATSGMRKANQEATDISENDKADAAAYKLSRVRQEIDVANEAMQVNPKATPEQKKKFQEIADKAAKAVPFTTDDAVKAMSPAKARTMAQAFNEKISQAKGEVTNDGVPKTNAKGWALHEDAQGNKAYVGPNNEIEEVN